MMSALQKWLMSRAGDAGKLSGMTVPQMLGAGVRKGAEMGKDSLMAMKANPKVAALGGAAGLGAGLSMGGGEEEEIDPELLEEIRRMRAYGAV